MKFFKKKATSRSVSNKNHVKYVRWYRLNVFAHSISVSLSRNETKTWSPLFVESQVRYYENIQSRLKFWRNYNIILLFICKKHPFSLVVCVYDSLDAKLLWVSNIHTYKDFEFYYIFISKWKWQKPLMWRLTVLSTLPGLDLLLKTKTYLTCIMISFP